MFVRPLVFALCALGILVVSSGRDMATADPKGSARSAPMVHSTPRVNVQRTNVSKGRGVKAKKGIVINLPWNPGDK